MNPNNQLSNYQIKLATSTLAARQTISNVPSNLVNNQVIVNPNLIQSPITVQQQVHRTQLNHGIPSTLPSSSLPGNQRSVMNGIQSVINSNMVQTSSLARYPQKVLNGLTAEQVHQLAVKQQQVAIINQQLANTQVTQITDQQQIPAKRMKFIQSKNLSEIPLQSPVDQRLSQSSIVQQATSQLSAPRNSLDILSQVATNAIQLQNNSENNLTESQIIDKVASGNLSVSTMSAVEKKLASKKAETLESIQKLPTLGAVGPLKQPVKIESKTKSIFHHSTQVALNFSSSEKKAINTIETSELLQSIQSRSRNENLPYLVDICKIVKIGHTDNQFFTNTQISKIEAESENSRSSSTVSVTGDKMTDVKTEEIQSTSKIKIHDESHLNFNFSKLTLSTETGFWNNSDDCHLFEQAVPKTYPFYVLDQGWTCVDPVGAKIKDSNTTTNRSTLAHNLRIGLMKIKFDETLHILEDSKIASPNFLNQYYYRDLRKKDDIQ